MVAEIFGVAFAIFLIIFLFDIVMFQLGAKFSREDYDLMPDVPCWFVIIGTALIGCVVITIMLYDM